MDMDWFISILLWAGTLWSKVAMSTLRCKILNFTASLVALKTSFLFFVFFFFQFKELEIIT